MIFVSFWVIFLRLPLLRRLRFLAYPFFMDITFTVVLMVVFSGTATGILAATFAGLLVSASISFYRRRYGFIRKNKYHVGRINLRKEIETIIIRTGAVNGRQYTNP